VIYVSRKSPSIQRVFGSPSFTRVVDSQYLIGTKSSKFRKEDIMNQSLSHSLSFSLFVCLSLFLNLNT
jgi:hypothetical protein